MIAFSGVRSSWFTVEEEGGTGARGRFSLGDERSVCFLGRCQVGHVAQRGQRHTARSGDDREIDAAVARGGAVERRAHADAQLAGLAAVGAGAQRCQQFGAIGHQHRFGEPTPGERIGRSRGSGRRCR